MPINIVGKIDLTPFEKKPRPEEYREFLKELPEDPEQWPTLLLNESQAERVQTLARGFAAKNKA